jgi:hypothetical protein
MSRAAPWLIAAACFALALWVRWRDLGATVALGDSMGPWLVAMADPLGRRPHAPPYGWALYPPYALILALSGSLWQAFAGLQLLHALAAPLTALAAWRLRPGAWGAALAAGALIALDGGLVNSAIAASKSYLAATWTAAMVLGLAARGRPWGPPLAWVAWAAAAMNHPFAAFTAPLLGALPWRPSAPGARWSWAGAVVGIGMLAPRLLRALGEGAPTSGGLTGTPGQALDAWLTQGGPGAWVLLLAPLVGLGARVSRRLAAGLLAAALLTAAAGARLGYLRDHHLRALAPPAAVCLAALPSGWGALALLALRVPPAQTPPADRPPRPGTLALANQLTGALLEAPRPLNIEGVRLAGTPAAEVSALSLDLHLRGWPAADLAPGGATALLISAERTQIAALSSVSDPLHRGDRHLLALSAPPLLDALCPLSPNIGGAWNWLAAAHPSLTLEAVPAPCL